MKKLFLIVALFSALFAKDTYVKHDIKDALESKMAKDILLGDISLSFSKTQDSTGLLSVKTKRSTSKYRVDKHTKEPIDMKEDFYKKACQYVFLTSLKDLQIKAKNSGKTSVINIQQNFKNMLLDSKDEFQCVLGSQRSTVSLIANLK